MSHEEPPHGPQRNRGLGTDRVHRKEVAAAGPVLTSSDGRVWFCALFSCLLAVVIGWCVSEQANRFIHWDVRLEFTRDRTRSQPERSPEELVLESRYHAEAKKTSLVMGILGAVLGLSLGAGGGLSRRSIRAAAVCGLGGFALGAVVGVAVPLQLVPVLYRSAGRPPNPAFPLLVHTALYAAIGGVEGAVFGIALGGWCGATKGMLAGAMGGILGAVTYDVLHTIIFPLEWDLAPLPSNETSRVFAHLCAAITSVACVVLATDQRVAAFRRGKSGTERSN